MQKTSLYSNVGFDNSIRLMQRMRLSSLSCIDDQNDFIILLSNTSPTESNEGDLPPFSEPGDLTPVFGPDSRMVQLGCVECFELGRGEDI